MVGGGGGGGRDTELIHCKYSRLSEYYIFLSFDCGNTTVRTENVHFHFVRIF